MKNFFIALFLAIIVISVVFFNALDNRSHQERKKNRLVVVQFYSDKCTRCRELNHKMLKVNWLLGREPILFINYDQSNATTMEESEKKLQVWGLTQTLKKERRVSGLSVFDLKSKKKLIQMEANDEVVKIESTLRKLLKMTDNEKVMNK